jgi:hypothetical protein
MIDRQWADDDGRRFVVTVIHDFLFGSHVGPTIVVLMVLLSYFLLQVIKILSTALVLDLIFQYKRIYIKNKAKVSV